MTDETLAFLLVGSVVGTGCITMAGSGMAAAWANLRSRWSRLGMVERAALVGLLAFYAGCEAIQWRYVLKTGGAARVAALVVSTLLPWIATAAFFFGRGDSSPTARAVSIADGRRSARVLAALAAFAIVTSIAWTWWRSNAQPIVIDESLYVFQARLLRHAAVALRVPESWQPFLALRQAVTRHGMVYSQYPPGWPGLLALWSVVAPMWLLAPALVGVVVLATFQLARSLGDDTIGLIAAALVATSGSLLYWGAGFMSDLPMTAVAVGSAAAVATSRSSAGTRSALLAVASGALLGIAFGVRPLTAICVAPIVLVVAILARARAAGSSGSLPTTLGLMAAGGLPIVAGVLAYNQATNGSPLVFGYAQASGALHSLGFGLRGFVNYTSMGEPEVSAEPFTPIQSLIGAGRQLASFNLGVLGGFFVPIFAAGIVLRTLPVRAWLLVGVTALLPAVHLAWFFTDPRYYLPLIPFLTVAAAGVIASSTDAAGRSRKRLMALLAVCNLVQIVSVMILDGYWGNPLARLTAVDGQFAAVEAARRQSDSTIVFVLDSGTTATTLWHLYPLNGEQDPKRPIIVVRDRGSANSVLTGQLTGWKAFCINPSRPEVVRPLRDGEEPTCRVVAASDGNGEKAK